MELSLENGRGVLDPTPAEIEQKLRTLDGKTNDYAILSKSPMTYLQTAGQIQDGFVIEYQDGDTDKHFKTTDEYISFDRLLAAFQDYAREGNNWRSTFEWEKLEIKTGSISRILILLFVGLVLLLIWKAITSL